MTAPPRFTFTCPRCGAASAHPEDAEHGWCAACCERTGQGLRCPECGTRAAMAIIGGSAFCDTPTCSVIMWDPCRLIDQRKTTVDMKGFLR